MTFFLKKIILKNAIQRKVSEERMGELMKRWRGGIDIYLKKAYKKNSFVYPVQKG